MKLPGISTLILVIISFSALNGSTQLKSAEQRFDLKSAEERNIILVGKTQSGKTTTVNVLRNVSYVAPLGGLFSDTQSPELRRFSVQDENDFVYNINIIDTPGLFEKAPKDAAQMARANEMILSLIDECLNFEITRINHVFVVVQIGSTLTLEERDTINAFATMFQGTEHHLSLLITFSELFKEKSIKKLEASLQQDEVFAKFLTSINNRVFYLGAVNEQMSDSEGAVDVALVKRFVAEQRMKLLKHILDQKSHFHVKSMQQYVQAIEFMDAVVSFIKKLSADVWATIVDKIEALVKFIDREKAIISKVTSSYGDKYEKPLSKFFKLEQMVEAKVVQKADENTEFLKRVDDGKITFVGTAAGHNNAKFELEIKGTLSSMNLAKGTIWVPKDGKNVFQPLVQKNRLIISSKDPTFKINLFMLCGDSGRKSPPQGVEYIPTNFMLIDPIDQGEVWRATTTYTQRDKQEI